MLQLVVCVGVSSMLSVRRHFAIAACKLTSVTMLRPAVLQCRPCPAVCSAMTHRNYYAQHTKAVIFDMGGVLIPSPLPFLAGMY